MTAAHKFVKNGSQVAQWITTNITNQRLLLVGDVDCSNKPPQERKWDSNGDQMGTNCVAGAAFVRWGSIWNPPVPTRSLWPLPFALVALFWDPWPSFLVTVSSLPAQETPYAVLYSSPLYYLPPIYPGR